MSGEVYVEDFPRLDGETNDHQRILRAIDACSAARGGTVIFGPISYSIGATLIARRGVSWRGQGIDVNYETPQAGLAQKRTTALVEASSFTGSELVKFDTALGSGTSYPIEFVGITFRGNAYTKSGIRTANVHLSKIHGCRFERLAIGAHIESIVDVTSNYFDACVDSVYVTHNATECLVAFNHGSALRRGVVVEGDGHRIIGNKLYGDARNAAWASPNPRSVAGVYVYGTRNLVVGNYIDQWMHAGIIIDASAPSSYAHGNGAEAFRGPYGNVVTGNVIYNCGHGSYTQDGTGGTDPNAAIAVSAGILLLVRPRASGDTVPPVIYRNIIVGNTIESGYSKGWALEGTTITATMVGVHLIGLTGSDIYDNVIKSNTVGAAGATPIVVSQCSLYANRLDVEPTTAGLTPGTESITLALRANNYYTASRGAANTVQLAEGIERGTSFVAGRTCTVTDLAAYLTTAGSAGATTRLALRADNQGQPGAVLAQGVADATVGGAVVVSGLAAQVVAGTTYWVTCTSQGGATTRPTYRSADNAVPTVRSSDPSLLLNNLLAGYGASAPQAGTLPDTASWGVTASIPRLAVKAAT